MNGTHLAELWGFTLLQTVTEGADITEGMVQISVINKLGHH